MRVRRWVLIAGLALVAFASTAPAAAAPPDGTLVIGVHVTLVNRWLDPGDTEGLITPFMVLYAIHDALVKPMPGNISTPSLAESWTLAKDNVTYDFVLRKGIKFHNGEPVTAEDVKFSFERYKGSGAKLLKERVKEVQVVAPNRVRIVLREPWPDFMAFYGTSATGAGWIVPKKYIEKVGEDGFKKAPIGAGPFKFVSFQPGVELVLEAFPQYWRKTPSVKRLVMRSISDESTRAAAVKTGEVDIAYLFGGTLAEDLRRSPGVKIVAPLVYGVYWMDFLDQWDPKSPWHDRRVRLAASLALDRKTLSMAETLGASRPTGGMVPRSFEFALALEPHPYDPAQAKKLLAEAGYPNGFDGGDVHPWPPYFSTGEAVANYLAAVGIRSRLRTMERAAFYPALASKKLKGICVCVNAVYGNAASRMSETVPAEGAFAYGAYPDIEALYRQQAQELDKKKRAALLAQIQTQLFERVRFAPIYEYIWPSGIGPRVEDPALMLIDPYPWSAPLEEVKLKKR